MARVMVLVDFVLRFPHTVDESAIGHELQRNHRAETTSGLKLKEKFIWASGHEIRQEDDGFAVELWFAGKVERTALQQASWAIRPLAADVADRAIHEVRTWGYDAGRAGLLQLRDVLHSAKPAPTRVLVPMLASDNTVLISNRTAAHAVAAAIREVYPFFEDQSSRIESIDVKLEDSRLLITAAKTEDAIDAGEAYLRAMRRQTHPRTTVPRTPVWAWASAAIAFCSVGLSFLTLSWPALAALAAIATLVAVIAVFTAPHFSAKRSITAIGLAPILTLCAFAFAYGTIVLLDPSAIVIGTTHVRHLRDPLLLSLSLLTTVGAFDLSLHGWVRSLAYLEMLLIASLAGGAAIIAVRRISLRARILVDELRQERTDG